MNIEEQRYSEFNNALPDYVLMGMVDMGIKNEEVSETTVIVQISNTITFTMIDRLLGGRGEFRDVNRDFTEIEITIMTDVMSSMAGLLYEPWATHIELEPKLIGIETNSRVVQTIAINLDEIMSKFISRYNVSRRKLDAGREAERRDNIMTGISGTDLNITAVLGEINLDLYEVLTLQVNDVIPLGKSISSSVEVKIGNKPWCTGKLGTYNNKKAVMIDNFIEN